MIRFNRIINNIRNVRLYHKNVIDHYESPRNEGSLDKKDKNVGTGLVGSPACGDLMQLSIEVDNNGIIKQSKFKTYGCGSAIASSSLATEWVKGKSGLKAIQYMAFGLPIVASNLGINLL